MFLAARLENYQIKWTKNRLIGKVAMSENEHVQVSG